ncbi:MAG: proline dehydrogenase family protein [Actinomycetes bacterium]
MIRDALASIARNESLGELIGRAPLARGVVKRVIGGDSVDDAVAVASELADAGRWVSLERAAPSVDSEATADAVLADYLTLVDRIATAGLAGVAEVSVFPGSLTAGPPSAAHGRLLALCEHATLARVFVSVGMGPAEHVDATLETVSGLQDAGLLVGGTVQASLKRSEADCRRLADRRLRLVKGGRRQPGSVAHEQAVETDKAYIRCAKVLLKGSGSPSFATHDPRMIEILESLTTRYERPKQSYEFAFYLGRQEAAQDRLGAAGERVRVYVPYGPDWFERLVGGLAEQPSSITAAVRSLLPGSAK